LNRFINEILTAVVVKRKYFAVSVIFESLYNGELYSYFLRDGMDIQVFFCFFVFYEHSDFGLLGSLKCFMVDLECQYLEKGRFCTILLKPLTV